MSNKLVFYSDKDTNELKKIKKEYPEARQRTQIMRDWATAHNRSYQGACLKINNISVRKKYTSRSNVIQIKHTPSNTVVLPIHRIAINDTLTMMTIEYGIPS